MSQQSRGNNRHARPHLEAENVRLVPGQTGPETLPAPEVGPGPEPQAAPPIPKGVGSLKLLKQMYRAWRVAGGTPDIFAPCKPPGQPMTPFP
jgi:hypothetical protein